MAIKSARNFFINKILFPKILNINEPGIITSKSLGIRKGKRRRMTYSFEEILSGLQLETLKELGNKKSSDLFYKIGKDVGTQYHFFIGKKKFPKLLRKDIVEYFFTRLSSVGMSFGKTIILDEKDNSWIFTGTDSLICRKTGNSSMFAGVVSGVLSLIVGKNIEAESRCKNCSESCKIIANENIPRKYIPDLNELKLSKDYENLNFPKKSIQRHKTSSLNNLYSFKKITVNKEGKSYFDGKALFFSEINMLELVAKNYLEDNKRILEKGIIKNAEKVADHLLRNLNVEEEKLNYIKEILGSFGAGIPTIIKNKRKITVSILYPPITKYGFLYRALEINGFLNSIYKKNFKLLNIKTQYHPTVTSLIYES